MTKESTIDILSFNKVADANLGGELELFYNGNSTGIYLHVIGKESDAVKQYERDKLKDYARKAKLAEQKGKEIDFQVGLIDKLDDNSIEAALVRVTDWRGAGAFDKAKLKIALGNNPQWIDEIIEFSNSVGK